MYVSIITMSYRYENRYIHIPFIPAFACTNKLRLGLGGWSDEGAASAGCSEVAPWPGKMA